jgi:hypothetical protein
MSHESTGFPASLIHSNAKTCFIDDDVNDGMNDGMNDGANNIVARYKNK